MYKWIAAKIAMVITELEACEKILTMTSAIHDNIIFGDGMIKQRQLN